MRPFRSARLVRWRTRRALPPDAGAVRAAAKTAASTHGHAEERDKAVSELALRRDTARRRDDDEFSYGESGENQALQSVCDALRSQRRAQRRAEHRRVAALPGGEISGMPLCRRLPA